MSIVTLPAQSKLGNEWIDVSKTYFKIKVAQDGIFRVNYEELAAAGFDKANVNGAELKLINFGKEQAIYVSDNNFGPGSYFEFYGEKNTIGLDSLLFDDWEKDLFNPEYSFVTDTNAYFLTISPNTNNLRYVLIDPDYNNISLSPFPYYLHEEKIIFSGSFFKNVDGDIRYSNFEPSEGFGDVLNQTSSNKIPTTSFVESGPSPVLKFRTGQNGHLSALEIRFNDLLKETYISTPKKTSQFSYTLDKTEIRSVNTLELKNVQSANDRHRLAYISLVYPRTFEFENKLVQAFSLPFSASKRFLEINGFKAGNKPVILYDVSKKIRYSTSIGDNKVKAIVNPVGYETKYILVNQEEGVLKVNNISVFNPKSFSNKGQEYVIISNKNLYNSGPDYVHEYADYRNSTIGGSYKTDIIEIQDIYDHFGYGIDRHFYSMKNLSAYLKLNWPMLKFVLLIGKSIEYPYIRTTNDVINYLNSVYFLPTFGYVGSDNMLFSEKNFPDPSFAIGRIAATTSEEINNYLSKVKQYEQAPFSAQTIQDKYWMKRVLHLGGGKNVFEQTAIRNGLNTMESIMENSIKGGEVFSFYKTSTDPIQFTTFDAITKMINSGVNVLTFFGHSAPGTWEFSVDNPANYKNTGKYPIINSLGCFSGNIHTQVKGISENWLLTKDKGAIIFFASTGSAFISNLSQVGNEYYSLLDNDYYRKSVGEISYKLNKDHRYAENSLLALFQQLTFHGDPAIKLYNDDGPDYIFDYESVKTEVKNITNEIKNIKIDFDILNLGENVDDSLSITFYHKLFDGETIDTINLTVKAPANRSSFSINLKNYGLKSLGRNTLLGIIDPKNKLAELPAPEAEDNNELTNGIEPGFDFYIFGNNVTPVFPNNFGIVPNLDDFLLKASTNSAPVSETTYIFQIDTTEYFNSPLSTSKYISSRGGLLEWKPDITKIPNTVYYWRVSPDSISPDGFKWANESFIYLPATSRGWNQSHFFQFRKNDFETMLLPEKTRKFEFAKSLNNARIRNKYYDINDLPGYFFNFVRFGSVNPWSYMTEGIGIVIYKQQEGDFPRNPVGGIYGSLNPTGASIAVFPFKTKTSEDRKNIIDFIENEIKEGFYLNLFTIVKDESAELNIEDWAADSISYGKNLFSVLEKLGAKKIRQLQQLGTVPYVLQLFKGEEGLISEEISLTKDGIIDISSPHYNQLQKGKIKSSIIGPSKKWKELDMFISQKSGEKDQGWVNIYGIKNNGNLTPLLNEIKSKKTLDIDAEMYPFLKIDGVFSDSLEKSSPQLDFWRVFYDGFPDAAILIDDKYNFYNDSLEQGDNLSLTYSIKNVNDIDMDSLLVKTSVINENNKEKVLYKKLAPLKAGQIFHVDFQINTADLAGLNNIIVELNPDNDQPEYIRTNNFLLKSFKVKLDNTNPLLDVYFDGIHILDGDIVSPKPEIKILLRDENKFLPVTDPNLFEVKLDTGRNELVTIPMSSPQIKFTPASENQKNAIVQYYPQLKTGEYKLLVQASDATGNKSGINQKSINFRVIEEQSISNVLNYPNPFSTSTQFVFTITGQDVPDIMSISIMTISGKVVKEITKEELGPLHIGVNRTEYKWDGTDDFNSKLANGIYLYKVNVRKSNGDKYNSYQNSKLDSYFEKGFGKMVILR